MNNLLKFLLNIQLKGKRSQLIGKTSGFTLIELLVGLVLAFLVLIPLLGFMVNILDTDRREQAKANTEQEIQTALNYISRDLDQAIYIYDDTGVDAIKNQLPPPNDFTGEPVLVFWKRQYIEDAIPVQGGTDDAFVYSLVAYYLTEANNCDTSTWSCTRQIRRFQIKDGVRNEETADPNDYIAGQDPDPGFKLFNLNQLGANTLEEKMNAWTSAGGYNLNETPFQVLMDYVDQSAFAAPPVPCSTEQEVDENGTPTGVPRWQAVPDDSTTYSFYACVDPSRITAQVFIRGNAWARIKQKDNPPPYVASQSAYFPRASVQVQGRGFLNEESSGGTQ